MTNYVIYNYAVTDIVVPYVGGSGNFLNEAESPHRATSLSSFR